MLCACSYDGGDTTTLLYKLPRPPSSEQAYCREGALSPPPPSAPPPPQGLCHAFCPQALDGVKVLDEEWRSVDWKKYTHYALSLIHISEPTRPY